LAIYEILPCQNLCRYSYNISY